jgi:YaiO family outer membrane protein
MIGVILLTGLLAGEPGLPAQQPGVPDRATAIELARGGLYLEALDAFRRLAAADPNDHEARVWIARLHGWMGHPDQAEEVYRSVLLENPNNLTALVGLGETLLARNAAREALVVLEDAERLAPDDAEVLALRGRAHRDVGETTRALAYMERAVAIQPSENHRRLLEQTLRFYRHRIEATGLFEDFNENIDDTLATDVRANIRLNDRLRVFGRGQVQRKFGTREGRGGLGLEWRWTPATTLIAHALVGPGDHVLPRSDRLVEIDHTRGAIEWTAWYRYIEFPIARVSVLSPGVTWWPNDRLNLGIQVHLAFTEIGGSTSIEESTSGLVNAGYRIYPRVWLNAGYARGVESFDTFSTDRLGEFQAHTISGGLRVDLASFRSILGVYEFQWREHDANMSRVTISLSQRF